MKSSILSCAIVLTLSLGALRAAYADSATWNLNPVSGDWNTAANWTPNAVPNGPDDIATFDASNVTNVSILENILLGRIEFNSGAGAFTIVVGNGGELSLLGSGIENNSGIMQNLAIDGQDGDATLFFTNSGTAGTLTTFTITGNLRHSVIIYFRNTSSAGNASFSNNGLGGHGEEFDDNASAGNGNFVNNDQGGVGFYYSSTADHATFTNNAAEVGSAGGEVGFHADSTAGESTITNNGSVSDVRGYGTTLFENLASADNATIINNGSSVAGGRGGLTTFVLDATANTSTLIANAGSNGGEGGVIKFTQDSRGVQARVEVFGNGNLDISEHNLPNVRVGSLEGDGLVFLGPVKLVVGSNGLSTTFSGVIEDTGELTKLGNGTLTLSGVNTYTGGTTVSDGVLLVSNRNGSGTGTGAVQVDAGTLGGRGLIFGAVTVGTGTGVGAFLSPSEEARKQLTLTIQSALTFKADGTYTYHLNTRKVKADKVVADGVTIEAGATFAFVAIGNRALTPGTVFTAISNTAATPISGTFANLPDGSTFTVGLNNYQVSYEGGNGNDLTLTVVP